MSNLSLSFSFYFWWLNYALSVTLTNNLSQSVNVMPDGASYWYGNEIETYTDADYHYNVGDPVQAYTKNANNMSFYPPTIFNATTLIGSASAIDMTNYSTLYVDIEAATVLGTGIRVQVCTSAQRSNLANSTINEISNMQVSTNIMTIDVSSLTGEYYIASTTGGSNGGTGNIPRIWLE